jgi:hypothetical protein
MNIDLFSGILAFVKNLFTWQQAPKADGLSSYKLFFAFVEEAENR